jgi:hypothetical protein
MIDILENAELPPDQMAGIRSIVQDDIDVPPMPDETKRIIQSLTDDDPLPFGKSGEAEEFIKGLEEDALPFGRSGEADEYIQSLQSQIDDLGKAEGQIDSLIKANAQRKADLARAEELMMDMENFGKSFDEIMKMVQDEKVIPFIKFQPNPKPKKAEGGIISRVGLQGGGLLKNPSIQDYMRLAGFKDFVSPAMPTGGFDTKGSRLAPAQIEENIKKQNFIRDNLPDTIIEDFKTSGFRPMGGDRAITNHPILGRTNYATSAAFNRYIDSLYEDSKLNNRIGLRDGGGPKISRRGFLGMLGAGIGSLFMPRGAKQIAESVAPAARIIKPAPGMPDWFPFLVDKIRRKGKIVREPDYKDFTSGGDTTIRYKLKDDSLSGGEIFLEEDLQSGAIGIFGRGDEGQQVAMDYYPGARTATKKGIKEDPATFEAGEFYKGEIQDFENIGVPSDDLRGPLATWENLSDIGLSPKEKIQRMMKNFQDEFKNPNVDPDDDLMKMSQGGGVGSLFKQRQA